MAQGSSRYWEGILYPENMIDNWKDEIYDLIELPFVYAVHDMDTDSQSKHKKDHVHLIVVFRNTTTYRHAVETMSRLSKPGCQCVGYIEKVLWIRHAYNYLIHDTEGARKANKYLYPESVRVEGNLFDIGQLDSLSNAEKSDMANTLCDCIIDNNICNFRLFYLFVRDNYGREYFDILKSYSGLFDRLIRGNFHNREEEIKADKAAFFSDISTS